MILVHSSIYGYFPCIGKYPTMESDSNKVVVDYSPLLLRSIWSLFAFSTVFAGLRVVAKLTTHRPLQWDDHFLSASWVSPALENRLFLWVDTIKFLVLTAILRLGLSPYIHGSAHQRCRLRHRTAF